MSRTGTCPLCNFSTALTNTMHGVLVCAGCYDNYRRLIALSNNGDKDAFKLIQRVSKKILELQIKPRKDKAFVYAENHWRF